MDRLLDQIKLLAATSGEETRQQLIRSLNNLALSLESPNDTVHRYGHMVSSCQSLIAQQRLIDDYGRQNLQTAIIRVGFDLNLFKLLSEAEGPVTAAEVARKTGSDAQLIRMMPSLPMFQYHR